MQTSRNKKRNGGSPPWGVPQLGIPCTGGSPIGGLLHGEFPPLGIPSMGAAGWCILETFVGLLFDGTFEPRTSGQQTYWDHGGITVSQLMSPSLWRHAGSEVGV